MIFIINDDHDHDHKDDDCIHPMDNPNDLDDDTTNHSKWQVANSKC